MSWVSRDKSSAPYREASTTSEPAPEPDVTCVSRADYERLSSATQHDLYEKRLHAIASLLSGTVKRRPEEKQDFVRGHFGGRPAQLAATRSLDLTLEVRTRGRFAHRGSRGRAFSLRYDLRAREKANQLSDYDEWDAHAGRERVVLLSDFVYAVGYPHEGVEDEGWARRLGQLDEGLIRWVWRAMERDPDCTPIVEFSSGDSIAWRYLAPALFLNESVGPMRERLELIAELAQDIERRWQPQGFDAREK